MQLPETKYRVCYADTDQMGIVYYGNYAKLFEIARGEAFRQMGVTYKSLEDSGIIMPVIAMEIKYRASALYDDLLTIETKISKFPTTRIVFEHKIYNEMGKLLAEGSVTLCFIDKHKNRPIKIPKVMETPLRELCKN